jgi:streptomycin 6-kinase
MVVPAGLGWWRREPGGAAWLERLPAVVSALAARWELEVGAPFEPARISLVVAVTRSDGRPAVLKVNFPEPDSAHEADALADWDGGGAARLLERSDADHALLVERLVPGTPAWALPDDEEATRVVAGVLRALHRWSPCAGTYRTLDDEAARWAEEVPARWEAAGRPFERPVLDVAVAALRELPSSTEPPTLLHQDLHGGNVLRDGDGWRAIDPKPLVGDPAFDAASLLRDRRWLLAEPGSVARLRRRLDVLAEELGLDRERLRLWGIAHALGWGHDGDGWEPGMVESARLLAMAR